MQREWNKRTETLLGKARLDELASCHVLVVGIGGVGAYAAEQIVRAGIGEITIVDADVIAEGNINRQLLALHSTLKQNKVDVMGRRLLDINPELILHTRQTFIIGESIEHLLDTSHFDYVVDAIDSLSSKVQLLYNTIQRELPLISSMGAGAKKDPSKIEVTNLYKTYNCPLARFVRKRLRHRGLQKDFPVVFSSELPDPNAIIFITGEMGNRTTTGTISYMPAIFGCRLAAHVILNIKKDSNEKENN
ncbi:MAG: tRNA threonylcarbamoyladenosine dehydratase [Massilibacteroides sp.]|nr:tRNA threonylcarbamoyladenosine dehydratase [Massilibacteroides sp.]